MSQRSLLIGACLLLLVIVAMLALRSEPDLEPYEVASAAEIASHARYERALELRVTFKFQQLPLDQAIQQIAAKAGVSMQIDARALDDASIGARTPVTLEVGSITLRSALKLLLNSLDLTWVLQDETLIVTTPEKAGNERITVVYPVADLVAGPHRTTGKFHPQLMNYQQLIDLLTAIVSPTTWDEVGGPGQIHESRAAGALVFAQSREVHAQVKRFLAALRKVRDEQDIRPGTMLTSYPAWPNGMPPMGQGRTTAPAQANPQPGAAGQPRPNSPAANSPVGTAPGGGFY